MASTNDMSPIAPVTPPAPAPRVSGPRVSPIGGPDMLGDSGRASGSGVPPQPPKYVVTSARTETLPDTAEGHVLRVRIRVRNASTFLLRQVRMAVAPFQNPDGVAVYALALEPPLKQGKSGWVEAQVEWTGRVPPAVWALLPPL